MARKHRSIGLLVLSVFLLFSVCGSFAGAEIPFGVSTTQVQVSGNVAADMAVDLLPGGKPGYYDEWKEGQWRNIRISGIEYDLVFWNVGKLGGTTGRLWWKKDYEDAVLTLNYQVSEYGAVVGKPYKIGEMDAYPLEEASQAPALKPLQVQLKFSGGPEGIFLEQPPYVTGESPLRGRVLNGKQIVFELPEGTTDWALARFCDQPLQIPGSPFFGWDLAEQNRLDSQVRFAGLSGQVEVRPDLDEDAWDFARMGMILYVEDHIKTGPRSGAILSFKDLSTFVMREETEIILATPPQKESKLELVAGNIWVNVKKMIKDGTMEITMNHAVTGIKGTILVCEESADTSTVKVLEGSVDVRDRSGNTVKLHAGEKVSATSQGFGEKELLDREAEMESWDELLESAALASGETGSEANAAPTENQLGNGEAFEPRLLVGAASLALFAGVLLFLIMGRKRK